MAVKESDIHADLHDHDHVHSDEHSHPTAGAGSPGGANRSSLLKKEPDHISIIKGRLTGPLIFAVLAAALGSSFIFGYNIGVINAGGKAIERWICEQNGWYPTTRLANDKNVTVDKLGFLSADNFSSYDDKTFLANLNKTDKSSKTEIWAWVGGLFPLGGMLGGLCTGFVADTFGRKGGMLLNTILTFVGGLIMWSTYFAGTHYVLWLGRFIIGINAGLNSGLAPMYLTEISPVNYRGLLGSVNQLMVTISILFSNILGMDTLLGTKTLWPYLLAFTIVPAVYQLITLPFCPESPKYLLIMKNQHDRARNALVKLRKTGDVEAEMASMQEEADKIKAAPKVQFADMFRQPVLRWALCIAVMMMLAQQLSGINAAMFYSTKIFEEDAKLNVKQAFGATIGMNVVNVLMTVVSTLMVDKAGRRTLLLIGLIGMWVSTILFVVSLTLVRDAAHASWAGYVSIGLVITFVISFATGPGSIPWFYVSECFEQGARGNANSVAVGVNWFAAFIVTVVFPHLQVYAKQFSFLLFTGFLTIFIIFTFKFVPETKGKTIEQVTAELRKVGGSPR